MRDKLTRQDVERIASLARLELSPDELSLFAGQLGDILTYAESLQRVDTSGVPPTAHIAVPAALAPLREDEPRPCIDRDTLLQQAPSADRRSGLLKVPRVVGS
jgi:aspartyl-tRNA(Asn)/glutamyl-tRNA(Gln) amidotransferase subunit C